MNTQARWMLANGDLCLNMAVAVKQVSSICGWCYVLQTHTCLRQKAASWLLQ
jgi:hypothetical protein